MSVLNIAMNGPNVDFYAESHVLRSGKSYNVQIIIQYQNIYTLRKINNIFMLMHFRLCAVKINVHQY
jgi:hypothetical protein